MIILKILMCILILIIIPAFIGMPVMNVLDEPDRSLGLCLPLGYTVELLIFELVTVPVLFLTEYENFRYVLFIFVPIMVILAAYGVFDTVRRTKKDTGYLKNLIEVYRAEKSIDYVIMWIVAAIILIVILVLVQTRVIFDGDDAYYVTQSLITQQNGTMYVTQPYTGRAAPIDMRHAMAVFTMWISTVGTLTGLHTTIVCHTVLPFVLLPLTFITYSELGLRLLRDKKVMLPYFVVFIELIVLFGRVSIYTSEAFLLARTWQGKSMAANLLIPMAFLALLIVYSDESGSAKRWLPVILVNAVAGIYSSLAVILVSLLILVGGFVLMIREKKFMTLIYAGCSCIPGLIYMLLYLYFTYFGWR